MKTDEFCLRWNDFESNISVAFRELRDDKDFFDVTLACDDNHQIQAHKVILSACSPFFRGVLRRNPHQHPLLYLKGVKYEHLQAVLNFMYHGEVNVSHDELNSFLSAAEDLKVKGLTQNNANSGSTKKGSASTSSGDNSGNGGGKRNQSSMGKLSARSDHADGTLPPAKRSRPSYGATASGNISQAHEMAGKEVFDDDIQEVVPVKSEPRDSSSMPVDNSVGGSGLSEAGGASDMYHHSGQQQVSTVASAQHVGDQNICVYGDEEANEDYDQYAAVEGYDESSMMDAGLGAEAGGADGNKGWTSYLDAQIDTLIFKSDSGKWTCSGCGKTFKHKSHLRAHVEARHMENTSVICNLCERVFKTREVLRKHRRAEHRDDES